MTTSAPAHEAASPSAPPAPRHHPHPHQRVEVSTSVEPVVAGFHPDPSVCRVGSVYYLANSSFEYFPAVPVHTSHDLLHWQLVGNALSDPQQFAPGHAAASKGVYAPTLRHHDGRFWLVTTDVSAGGGQLLVSAEDAAGPWSPAVTIAGLDGIDPDLAWEEDGTCYLTYCSRRPGLVGIAQARVDLAAGVALEAPRLVWEGSGLAHPEGPHLHHVNGWWYLVVAEGGTERGHAVTVARSRSPRGPFEGCPHNPVLSHRSLSHPVQNTGHADLVQNADGSWAVVYLGVRLAGPTPWFHVNGRETFLAGVDWQDGWPRVVEDRYHRQVPDRSWHDAFDADGLHPRWVSPGHGLATARLRPGGGLILTAGPNADPCDSLLARVTDRRWEFAVDLAPGGAAHGALAAVLRLDDSHTAVVSLDGGSASAGAQAGPFTTALGSVDLPAVARVSLTISAVDSDSGPDDVVLAAIIDGALHQLGRVDGRYLSTEVAGGFTGRMVGVRADRGTVQLDGVRYMTASITPGHPVAAQAP